MPFKVIVFLTVLKTLSNLIWSNELTKVPGLTLSKIIKYLKSQNCQQRRRPGETVGAPTWSAYRLGHLHSPEQKLTTRKKERKCLMGEELKESVNRSFRIVKSKILFLPQIESFPGSQGKRIKKLLAYSQVPFGRWLLTYFIQFDSSKFVGKPHLKKHLKVPNE